MPRQKTQTIHIYHGTFPREYSILFFLLDPAKDAEILSVYLHNDDVVEQKTVKASDWLSFGFKFFARVTNKESET